MAVKCNSYLLNSLPLLPKSTRHRLYDNFVTPVMHFYEVDLQDPNGAI